MIRSVVRLVVLTALCLAASATRSQSPEASDWGNYGGDGFGQRFSELDQIRHDNVRSLRLQWSWRAGGPALPRGARASFAVTPVLAFGALFVATPAGLVAALDPVSGRELWRFDPHPAPGSLVGELTARGLTAWEDAEAARGAPCRERVYAASPDARLFALDAQRGTPCAGFAQQGALALALPGDTDGASPGSPPVVVGNVLVVGAARAGRGGHAQVRGFEVRTGAPLWAFDALPDGPTHPAASDWQPGQAQATGGARPWGPMSVDEEQGLVFVPTGAPTPPHYGGGRVGEDRYSDSLLALEARTGRLVWAQQLVHHDLWGFDLGAQPVLGDLQPEGVPVPAVIQAGGNGLLFAFERTRGRPLVSIDERAAPVSHIAGEHAAATQPIPALPALIDLRPVRPDEAWGLTFWDRARCRQRIAQLRNEGVFTPPDARGSLVPGALHGAVSWGGIAYDEQHERVIAAVNHLPAQIIVTGQPGPEGTRYVARREPLLSPWGLPCTAPPWGSLVSVDLRHARIVWQVPLGSSAGFLPWFAPVREFGVPNAGGPIATAGNLVFVAAALDGYLRAFDLETGRQLWRHRLPAGGQATPMTYRAGPAQRQYVVIAAGGDAALGTTTGDFVLAFALPPSRAAR